jgi:chromosome segregation ATPase
MAEVEAARDNLETLRVSSEQSSSAAAEAADTEREALLRARTDFETMSAEADALRASHASTLQALQAELSEARAKAAAADALEAQVEELQAEREETANKLSELEVEILELKESQEEEDDEHAKVLDRLKELEEELADAATATQNALDASKAREAQHAQLVAKIEEGHDGELQAAKNEFSKVVADLEGLREELAAAHAAHEQTKIEAQSAAEEHERQLDESEGEILSKHLEFSEEIKKITAELEASCYLTSQIVFSHERHRVKKHSTTHELTLSRPSMNNSWKRHLSVPK